MICIMLPEYLGMRSKHVLINALNPESAHLFYTAVQVTDGGK